MIRFLLTLVLLFTLSVRIGASEIAIEKELLMAIWEKCYSKTLKFEGGFQKIFNDRGNWTGGAIGKGKLKGTKYGISAASYPNLDIENLTKEQAIEIYRKDYWDALHLTTIDSNRVAWKVFDIAINCGKRTAVRILQRSLGVDVDGIIGKITLEGANMMSVDPLMDNLVKNQENYYNTIHNDDNDWAYEGWIRRAKDTAPELGDQ